MPTKVSMTHPEKSFLEEAFLYLDSESSPCAGEPCGLEGVCIPMPDAKYVCLCQNRVIAAKSCDEGKRNSPMLLPRWALRACSARMDPCTPHNPCRNGRCISNERGGFQCKCRTGWSGRRCDQGTSDKSARDSITSITPILYSSQQLLCEIQSMRK